MANTTDQPLNSIGEGIQVFTPSSVNDNVNITTSDTSQLIAIPNNVKLLRIACTADCYIKFGDVSAVADTSSILYKAGVEPVGVSKGVTHLAVIQADTSGVCSVSYGEIVNNAFVAS